MPFWFKDGIGSRGSAFVGYNYAAIRCACYHLYVARKSRPGDMVSSDEDKYSV